MTKVKNFVSSSLCSSIPHANHGNSAPLTAIEEGAPQIPAQSINSLMTTSIGHPSRSAVSVTTMSGARKAALLLGDDEQCARKPVCRVIFIDHPIKKQI
jgi:hypothetical protein